jgi:hypothetical protein
MNSLLFGLYSCGIGWAIWLFVRGWTEREDELEDALLERDLARRETAQVRAWSVAEWEAAQRRASQEYVMRVRAEMHEHELLEARESGEWPGTTDEDEQTPKKGVWR